jgi:hypothetical protein
VTSVLDVLTGYSFENVRGWPASNPLYAEVDREQREASMLGFTPGEWPTVVELDGQSFRRFATLSCDGAVMSVAYVAASGRRVVEVLNY